MSETPKHTPLPWWIRRNPHNQDEGILVAKPTEDHPYFGAATTIDVLGDEDYPRKMADMELIVQAVNSYPLLKEAEEALSEATVILADRAAGGRMLTAVDDAKKVLQKSKAVLDRLRAAGKE